MPYISYTVYEKSRNWSPLNYGSWISIDLQLFLTNVQTIASIVCLILSRHEQPHMPLRIWIILYLSGCAATLPLIWWYWCPQTLTSTLHARLEVPVKFFKWVLHCFFLVLFAFGWALIAKQRSFRLEAPMLYRFPIAFLIFCTMEYAWWIVISLSDCLCIRKSTTVTRYCSDSDM